MLFLYGLVPCKFTSLPMQVYLLTYIYCIYKCIWWSYILRCNLKVYREPTEHQGSVKDAKLILDLNSSNQSIIQDFKCSYHQLERTYNRNGLLWCTMQRDPHCYNIEISFKYWVGKRINFHFHCKHDRAIASQCQMTCELHLDCISFFLPRLPKLPVPAHLNNICWAT